MLPDWTVGPFAMSGDSFIVHDKDALMTHFKMAEYKLFFFVIF